MFNLTIMVLSITLIPLSHKLAPGRYPDVVATTIRLGLLGLLFLGIVVQGMIKLGAGELSGVLMLALAMSLLLFVSKSICRTV